MSAQSVDVDLQEELFRAIGEGDLVGMRQAYEKGADPHKPPPNGECVSAWLHASLYAPLSTIKEVFALLETWQVERRCGPSDVSGSHPCIELTLRAYENEYQGSIAEKIKQVAHYGHTLAWDLWNKLDQQERRRVLLTLDVCIWGSHRSSKEECRNCIERIWHTPSFPEGFSEEYKSIRFLEAFRSDEFKSIRAALQEKPLSLLSSLAHSPSPKPPSEETIFWCLQSLFLPSRGGIGSEFSDGHPLRWGVQFLTAPDAVLEACLENEGARALIMNKIEERALTPLYCQEPILSLIHHFHTRKVLCWPEAWPESTRTALLKIPLIYRFTENELLVRTLDHTTTDISPSSSPRQRL